MNEHWSLGVLIGLPVWLIATLALAGLAVWVARDEPGMTLLLGGIALLSLIGLALGFYPYGSDYHKWKPVNGTVAKVESRLVNDGESSTERYVIEFTDGRERACDDTRCTLVNVGDTVHLSCKRHYQWASTPGWDCNFVKRVAK